MFARACVCIAVIIMCAIFLTFERLSTFLMCQEKEEATQEMVIMEDMTVSPSPKHSNFYEFHHKLLRATLLLQAVMAEVEEEEEEAATEMRQAIDQQQQTIR